MSECQPSNESSRYGMTVGNDVNKKSALYVR